MNFPYNWILFQTEQFKTSHPVRTAPQRILEILISTKYLLRNSQMTRELYATMFEFVLAQKHRNRKYQLYKTRMTMRGEISEKLAPVSTTGPFLVRDGSKSTVILYRKSLVNGSWPESAGEAAAILMALPETYTSQTMVSLVKDAARHPCSQL